MSRLGVLRVALAAALWGTVGVAVGFLYNTTVLTALSIGFYRLAFAAPLLALAHVFVKGGRARRTSVKESLINEGSAKDGAAVALMGVMLAVYQICYFAAIARVGVAVATLLTLCTAPVIVAGLSFIFLGERLTKRLLAALVLATLGTVLLTGLFNGVRVGGGMGDQVLGVLLALGSATGYAVVVLLSRTLAGRVYTFTSLTGAFAVGALALLPFALLSGLTVRLGPLGWLTLLYLGLVPSALGYVLFLAGMRTTPATAASIVTLLEPLTATLLAWLLFGERLGAAGLAGGTLLVFAIVLLSLKPRKTEVEEVRGR